MQTIHRPDSYYEEYKRSQCQKDNPLRQTSTNTHKLMTDRSSYMAFLEVELERVSAACMTVQGYKERLSSIDSNHHELEDKLKQYSRALKLSSTMMERRDHETHHKFDNLESRMGIIERKQSSLETDAKMFLNGDLPSILNEVRQTVKREMVGMTEKYAIVESRCNEMITDRLDGYTDVYGALEKKLGNLVNDNLNKYKVKMLNNNEEIKEWMRKYMKQCSSANMDAVSALTQRIQNVEEMVNSKVDRLEHQLLREQPKYIKGYIQESIERMEQQQIQSMKSNKSSNDDKLKMDRTAKTVERAERTCSKIADDVYKRLQSQRCDLFDHIKSVEQRIGNQLKETIEYLTERDLKQQTVRTQDAVKMNGSNINSKINTNTKSTSRSMTDHQLLADSERKKAFDPERIDLNSLRNQILDYRSEMVYSQQKLSDLENTFTAKLKKLQNETRSNSKSNSSSGAMTSEHSDPPQSVHNTQKLADLDRKYSEIQKSIHGLQHMLKEFDPEQKVSSQRKNSPKKKKRKRKSNKKSKRQSVTTTKGESDECSSTPMLHRLESDLPQHLGPHLSDLDNLVQSVYEADRIDKKHSINKTKNESKNGNNFKPKRHRKRIRKTSCPGSPRKAKTLWK